MKTVTASATSGSQVTLLSRNS